ncbi:unnamed protein product [Cuscuta epithymum]|uniref:Leucine-rich repeat-containing N-terminal plant-type domain-containing protein n=1 Tax=Cuscuta epithymum TaxID=186058 RepID=A0AAV0F2H6_9ASTE|nr:unnamed protein product [Cuscuta epithymum]
MGRLSLLWASTESAAMAVGVSYCLLLAMSGAAAAAAIPKCIDGEREVLLKFKHSVLDWNGELGSWGYRSEDCCRDWVGVRCDDATGHVTHIDLFDKNLSAKDGGKYTTSLPFFELRYLNYLDLGFKQDLLANQSISLLIGDNTMVYLQYLNLNQTGYVGTIPENLGNTMPSLTYLDLSLNSLTGSIPETFGDSMAALKYLDLSANSLEGYIPDTLGNMVKLTHLDLGSNLLKGCIPKALGSMPVLEKLDLGWNRLEGEIPKSIWNICTLQLLNMASNRLNGSLTTSTLCPNHPLSRLRLSSNQFTGLFPNLTVFPSLANLDLSDNLLDGVISEHHFLNLSKLTYLDLSSNNFTFNVSSAWLPPFQLQSIYLSSCKLGPEFPNWLRTQVHFTDLDISNNVISDSIPSWFWNTPINGFMKINISNNRIKGILAIGAQASIRGGVLDMSSNQLEGVIPPSFFNVAVLHLSQNKFTNLNSLCDIEAHACVELLDISFNQLSGTLPNCWSSLSSLKVLNLGYNHNLSGTLPTSFGSLASLKALHLDNNKFTGPLPLSMKNCSSLVSLDLGHNDLFGPIPDWVGENLTQLVILVLTSNNFNASVPASMCHLQSLQLLDLSMNHISGTLPNCLSNLTKMMTVKKGHGIAPIYHELQFNSVSENNSVYVVYEVEKISFIWKGMIFEFGSILGYVQGIDLSSNMLSGEIPTEITLLVGLASLNLSRNNLKGQIPSRIGNLAQLNTLDLSSNHLSGSIPQSLALIYGIGILNVSNNNLSGRIPKGTQLQSFNASVYMGNPALCGDPLPNSCAGEESTYPSPPGSSEEEEDRLFGSEFYASLGVGYVVGFWVVLGTMLFNRSCRFAFFNILGDIANWTYVVAATHKAKFLRSLGLGL